MKLAYDFVKENGEKNIVLWGISMGAAAISKSMICHNLPAEKKLVVYDNSGHESLCKNENAKWLSEVQNFLGN